MLRNEIQEYFSIFYDIIPKQDAEMIWNDGGRGFVVLLQDGTTQYADEYNSFEEIIKEDCLFGLERID